MYCLKEQWPLKWVWSFSFHFSPKASLQVQFRMIFWMVSGMKSSKKDFMSCTWVTAIRVSPGSILITLSTIWGGSFLGQGDHSISHVFDIHISPPAGWWWAGLGAGSWQAGLGAVWIQSAGKCKNRLCCAWNVAVLKPLGVLVVWQITDGTECWPMREKSISTETLCVRMCVVSCLLWLVLSLWLFFSSFLTLLY